jgi:hypothetical protein
VISHTDLNRSADIPIFRLWTRLCKILKSHGAVLIEQYRQAASYVDRITVGAHQRARQALAQAKRRVPQAAIY